MEQTYRKCVGKRIPRAVVFTVGTLQPGHVYPMATTSSGGKRHGDTGSTDAGTVWTFESQ